MAGIYHKGSHSIKLIVSKVLKYNLETSLAKVRHFWIKRLNAEICWCHLCAGGFIYFKSLLIKFKRTKYEGTNHDNSYTCYKLL